MDQEAYDAFARQLFNTYREFFVDEAECHAIAPHFEMRDWETDQDLLVYGQPSDTMYFVQHGALSITMAQEGTKVLLAGSGDGAFVGELGCLRPGPASATVRTAATVRTFSLNHERLTALLGAAEADVKRAASHLVKALCHIVAQRIRRSSAGYFAAGKDVAMLETAIQDLHTTLDAPFEGAAELPTALDTSWSPDASERKRIYAKLEDMLAEQPELAPLGKPTCKVLSDMIMPQRGQPGDIVIGKGADAHGIFIVVEGAVRVVVPADEGSDFHADRRMGPGETFGIMSYILSCAPTASIEIVEPNTIIAAFFEIQVQKLFSMGESGLPIGGRFLHWLGGQLADDARALNERILEDFRAWSSSQG